MNARLYLVCHALCDEDLNAALRGGVDIVQLRLKDTDDEAILSAATRIRSLCAGHGVPLIINDRPDLAAQAGADGVHLGQDDMPIEQARAIVGPDRIIGLSTHTPQQIEAAGEQGVDYIGVGPVNTTPTKPGRPAVGTELVAYAAKHAAVPFFAIGGIDPSNIDAIVAAGAQRVAVVRAITESPDAERAARQLRTALDLEARGVAA